MHQRMNRRGFLKGAIWTGAVATVGGAFGKSVISGGNALKELGPIGTDWEFRRAKGLSGRKAAMYIDEKYDITDDVVKGLNKRYNKVEQKKEE